MTTHKKAYDPATNKLMDFEANTVFTVYTRRSNCAKKVIYTGKDINKALKIFHNFKVFDRDYKYLMFLEGGIEHILYRNVGTGVRPKMQGRREGMNYLRKRVQIESVSLSLWNEFYEQLKVLKKTRGAKAPPSVVIPHLIAYFCSLTPEQQMEFLNDTYDSVMKHIILSGGDNNKKIQEHLVATEAEELL